MQTVSDLHVKLFRSIRHRKEIRMEVAGITFGMDRILSLSTAGGLYASPRVGGTVSRQIEAAFIPGDVAIPRMAEIKLQTRLACAKYAASAVAFMKPLADSCSVVTPDGQTYYFTLNYWSSIQYGSLIHYATLYWSVSGGLTGVVGGAYQVDAAGTQQKWEEAITFTQTPPAGEVTSFNALKQWFEDGWEYSEWIPKGTFYIDTRKLDTETGVLTINGYDAMLKSEVQFLQDGDTGEWPRASSVIVGEICELMGVELDERTELDDEIKVPYPNDWTAREILSMVGTAHCGNWTITDAGKLRLVPLWSIPEATHYLVDQYGDPITLGGVRILV